MRASILILGVILLAGCAGNSGAGWPGQLSPNPTAYDFPIVEKRWAAASLTPLGSAQDVAAITAALKKAHPDMVVHEIRWLSATEVMALLVRGDGLAGGEELFYGVLEKSGDSWSVVAWYDGSIA
jgi:ABC-type glycerol-3-phosphate transport system substrate-binding protein